MSAIDRRHMARALDLARRGLYSTGPNPRVGCVIARGGRVVGEGWHRYAGEPHAEIHALAAAGGDSRGATAYVTLEPCRHTGRTGPCTRALIEAGIAKVVAAMPDPDPRVAGRGFAELAEAGIEVETGLMEAPARELNRGFVSRHERGRPWIRCKLAATLDGRTATVTGESRWITGEAARADVHRLRARADAVLTGIGTLLADDPRLDARVVDVRTEDVRTEDAWTEDARTEGARMEDARMEDAWTEDARMEDTGCLALPMRSPMRVIVDSRLRTPPSARALSAPGDVLIATIGGAGATGGIGTAGGIGTTGGIGATGDDGAEGPVVGGITREPGHILAATAGGDAEEPLDGGIARAPGDTLAVTTGGGAEGSIVGGVAGEPGDTLAAMAGGDAAEGSIVGGIAGEPGDTLAVTTGGGAEGSIVGGIARESGDTLAAAAGADAAEGPIVGGVAGESGDTLAVATGADAARMRALIEAGAEIVPLPDVGGRVSLPALMAVLAGRGVNEVHTECGPTLAGALLESGLVDEIVVYLAPALLGDAARGMFTLPGVAAMRDRLWLEITGVVRLGADLRIDAVPKVEADAEQRAGEAG